MKKKLSALLLALCCLWICLFPASALEPTANYDAFDEIFLDQTTLLDWYFMLDTEYMHYLISDALYPWEEHLGDGCPPVTVSAADFEAILYRHFRPTDDQLTALRIACSYDSAHETYQLQAYGLGGGLPPRRYMGYTANSDGTYDIFWQNITYGKLDLTDAAITEALEAEGWPDTWNYGGKVYHNSAEGYVAILSYDSFGRRYHVELNQNDVRFLSCDSFSKADLPATFDHVKQVTVSAPDGIGLSDATDAFPDYTRITIETRTDAAMIASLIEAFPETADHGNWAVYTFSTNASPQKAFSLQIALPEEAKSFFVCLRSENGNFRAMAYQLLQTEFGTVLSVPLSPGTLPDIAFFCSEEDMTPPITDTSAEESAPPDSIEATEPPDAFPTTDNHETTAPQDQVTSPGTGTLPPSDAQTDPTSSAPHSRPETERPDSSETDTADSSTSFAGCGSTLCLPWLLLLVIPFALCASPHDRTRR